jgi:hypothetical protein
MARAVKWVAPLDGRNPLALGESLFVISPKCQSPPKCNKRRALDEDLPGFLRIVWQSRKLKDDAYQAERLNGSRLVV